MKTRQGFVSNSSSSSFVCLGCKLTPAVKAVLKEKFPKQKNDEGNTEADWEWLDRVCEELDMETVSVGNSTVLGQSLAGGGDYMDNATYDIKELQTTIRQIRKVLGKDADVKLYMGTEQC